MEEKESYGSGKLNEAPGSFHLTWTNDNSGQFAGGSEAPAPAPASVATTATATAATTTTPGTEVKKKRGRPRKYGPDGTMALALSPMPISSSIPLTGDYSGWKRGRGKPVESIKKSSYKFEYESAVPAGSFINIIIAL